MTEPLNPTELAALYRDVPTSTTGFTLCRQEERLMQYLRNHVPAIITQAAKIERYEAALRLIQSQEYEPLHDSWTLAAAKIARAALEGTSP